MHHKNHMMTRKTILEVHYIELSVRESKPRQLHVRAIGTVPSPGWSAAELIPFVYIQPPPDGIYDFTFTAQAPKDDSEAGGSSYEEIKVTHVLSPLTNDLKGVRIHASSNSQIALIEQGSRVPGNPGSLPRLARRRPGQGIGALAQNALGEDAGRIR